MAYVALFGVMILVSTQSTPENFEESDLKAALLNYFFVLIRWPDSEGSETTFFCSPGDNPVSRSLEDIIRLQQPENGPANLSLIATAREAALCDYVFVDSQNSAYALPVIAATRGLPVLTVSDIEGFATAGGAIELKREKSRIAVVINVEVLEQQGLKASSRLLSLATRITGK